MEVVKTFQVLLDGVQAFPRVHLIGLSNLPEAIPPAIVRRMSAIVTDRLSSDEQKELVLSRLSALPIDEE